LTLLVSARWMASPAPQDGQEMIDPSEASMAIDLSMDELINASSLIAIGRCVGTQSTWVDRSLVTLAKVSVNEVLKGDGASEITVVLPGGVDANRQFPIAMTYPGAPRITPDENVFLFLSNESEVPSAYTIMGFSQGKFSIVKDDQGRDVVSRDLTRMGLQSGRGVRRGGVNTAPLSDFRGNVLRKLRRQ
jgi:hypothetical protein